jgi:hypothetical protein
VKGQVFCTRRRNDARSSSFSISCECTFPLRCPVFGAPAVSQANRDRADAPVGKPASNLWDGLTIVVSLYIDRIFTMLLSNLWVGVNWCFLFGAASASWVSPRASSSEQLRLHQTGTNTALSHNYSVGISLQSSYIAGAVVIRDTQGNVLDTFTKVIPGGWAYDAVMARLSLDSSRHLA